ncbi:ATP-dependent metallopeptidase FtsH/Yme1/Tma family protein [Schleiferilactobacillus harbinensis]|uniref:ATP-dependent zinc metalloprotease FtsH n=1 Tax=Schleiferilactobacillus harbinensis TaxID=304207 RepID=UPI0021A519BC|nr:ATP-dependent zinc metalloprotease FtsH [Schleiferilactobacillus harbinensis]MCT2908353.1 ATP-dependent metallopeptidase FtsH/Yme1/Tma family protein [Schleiferilactobacillus harbinensis]
MKNRRNGLFRSGLLYFFIFVVLVALVSTFIGGNGNGSRSQEIKSSTFITELQDKKIKDFNIQPSGSVYKVSGTYREPQSVSTPSNGFGLFQTGSGTTTVTNFTTTVLPNDATLNQIRVTAKTADVSYSTSSESNSGFWLQMLFYFVPTILVIAFFWFMMNSANQGGGGNGRVMSFGKSKAKPEDPKKNKVRFSDVAGAEEEKQELVEVVEFLKDPRKYSALGAHIPHGVLLEGPPGTGKTLLARAVAGEAGVPFFSISGSDFVEMFVGVGASRVRDLFDNAKKAAPSIIFIDEIDAVGRQRGAGLGGGHDEREQTLNQLLVEMDGFTGNEGVIVIAATNRADVLDPALLRPGRFDRKVLVGRPDVKGREAILRVHAKNKPLAPDVDLKVVAQQTPGFVGADLENLLNEAALVAARRNKTQIDSSDIDEATDRVIAGPAKHDRVISPKERNMVAYHEAGHAIIGLVLSDSRTVRKVTIVPRGQAGGYAIMLPKDDQFLVTKKELNEQIVGLMGGRTAEEIIFGTQSTGASNDFEQATQIAREMVTKYGMTERLGTVALASDSQPFVGAEYGQAPVYSQATAAAIDDEVRQLIDSAHKQAYEIIEGHRAQHKAIAEALLKYETLNEKQILSLFNTGEMPADQTDEYPSEQSGTFEEAKKALEERDHEKSEQEAAHNPSSTAAENPTAESASASDAASTSASDAPQDPNDHA